MSLLPFGCGEAEARAATYKGMYRTHIGKLPGLRSVALEILKLIEAVET